MLIYNDYEVLRPNHLSLRKKFDRFELLEGAEMSTGNIFDRMMAEAVREEVDRLAEVCLPDLTDRSAELTDQVREAVRLSVTRDLGQQSATPSIEEVQIHFDEEEATEPIPGDHT